MLIANLQPLNAQQQLSHSKAKQEWVPRTPRAQPASATSATVTQTHHRFHIANAPVCDPAAGATCLAKPGTIGPPPHKDQRHQQCQQRHHTPPPEQRSHSRHLRQ
ncbi:MAG: hypothetical protein ACK53Y_04920, partial [bacterium]